MLTREKGGLSPEFEERMRFYRATCNIDLRDYIYETDERLQLDIASFRRDVMASVLEAYDRNAPGIVGDEAMRAELLQSYERDGGVNEVPPIVFNRTKVNSIVAAEGDGIRTWFDVNLKEVTDRIVEMQKSPSADAMAGMIIAYDVVALGYAAAAGYAEYCAIAPAVPLALESAYLQPLIAAALAHPGILAATAVAAAAIGVALTAVAFLDRELTGLIINDTPFDVAIEKWHMEHGYMDSMVVSDKNVEGMPLLRRRASENMVYCSFFTISKSTGFYGAECTMKITPECGDRALYFLSANPLSEKSRVNLAWGDAESWNPAGRVDPGTWHARLYDAGGLAAEARHDGIRAKAKLNSEHGSKAYAVLHLRHAESGHVDFTSEPPRAYGAMGISGSTGFGYDAAEGCYALQPGGFVALNAYGGDYNRYELTCRSGGTAEGKLRIDDDARWADPIDVYPDGYAPYSISHEAPRDRPHIARDLVQVTNTSGVPVYIRQARFSPSTPTSISRSDWMGRLPDSTPLADINIPASHDTAAVNSFMHTPWACHHASITQQLLNGMRAFDIRIKVKEVAGEIVFATCHGSLRGITDLNEFEPLDAALDRFSNFLESHPTEALVVTLKIDDNRLPANRREEVLGELSSMLGEYPCMIRDRKDLPSLGEARGHAVLFSRISGDARFGYVLEWGSNTKGEFATDAGGAQQGASRDFPVYVQDHFQFGFDIRHPGQDKADLVKKTSQLAETSDGTVFLNYASACVLGAAGVYCHRHLIDWLGGETVGRRPKKLGWVFMDYESDCYYTDEYANVDLPGLIIASNFQYEGFTQRFKVIG